MEENFKKSSFCGGGNSSCVEIKTTEKGVELRDSRGNLVKYTKEEWRTFTAGVKNGEFDV